MQKKQKMTNKVYKSETPKLKIKGFKLGKYINYKIKIFFLLYMVINLSSCFSFKKANENIIDSETDIVFLDEIDVLPETNIEIKKYQPAKTIINKLKHTKLDLSFDFENQYVFGEATITLSPFFYDTDSLNLDAKHFDIERIAIIDLKDTIDLIYNYNDTNIRINLDKTYKKSEEYTVFIKYIAKPNELENKGNGVYSDTKGLYFINPTGKSRKTQQIWTQGETEYSSCWFPTIDSPNQRCTGEIFLTVPAKFVTLSNGEYYNSLLNVDTTRTDHWKMELPIAPYLFMIAAGEFEIIIDEWRQIEVNYYFPNYYEEKTEQIFRKTPKMIEFYSQKFGYDYPWNKYSQIIVEDFVSGAMENATATVFGSFMDGNSWWYTDLDKELVIAHELSHHWFGNLVTCESWANIAMNEAFATYSEYLWLEYQYSKEDADYQLYSEESYYMYNKSKPIIDYYYDNKDDMFNTLVYQKAAKILHTLRNYIGDDAFFLSLKTYLKKFEYSSVEIDDFRLVVEEITGEDLNWFFEQWFFTSGFPTIEVEHHINDSLKTYKLTLNQFNSEIPEQIYFLPIDVNIYFEDEVVKERIIFDKKSQIFEFQYDKTPIYIEIDPEHTIICEKLEEITTEQFEIVLKYSENGISKLYAIDYLSYMIESQNKLKLIYLDALENESWLVREYAIDYYNFTDVETDASFVSKIKELSENDINVNVRIAAERRLDEIGD